MKPVLEVDDLRVSFATDHGAVHAVRGVSFTLMPGRTLGLVGESGSGKTVTALAVLRLLPDLGLTLGGRVAVGNQDVFSLDEEGLCGLRGGSVGMVFQEPMSSLNPVFRVGDQVAEAVSMHQQVSHAEANARALGLLREVVLADHFRRYPHELSGGQKQRVMIAMALANDPVLLIADEPTTALDVSVQDQLLELLAHLRRERGMAMLFVSHDLSVVSRIADDVAVMLEGRIVEMGPVHEVMNAPKHSATGALLACRLSGVDPRLPFAERQRKVSAQAVERRPPPAAPAASKAELRAECLATAEVILEVENLRVHHPLRAGLLQRTVGELRAVDGVSFCLRRGETFGLVGASGSGKSTVARAVLGLVPLTGGCVRLGGAPVSGLRGAEARAFRRRAQAVFQDPYSALDPRWNVRRALHEPLLLHGLGGSAAEREARVLALLEEVGLGPEHLDRYPHELSGGQRQRIGIARALAVEPELLILDECVSALDVTVQSQVLDLLIALQDQRGLTYLFISHDLDVVRFMADRVGVMREGKLSE